MRMLTLAIASVLAGGCAQPPAAPARRGLSAIMQEKLIQTQAVMIGLARADHEAMRRSALVLAELSERSAWMAHDTVAYESFSRDFRETARRLADEARQRDLDAAAEEYVELTRTCVACHNYLRQERLIRDFPAEVSQTGADDPLARLERAAPGAAALP